MDLICATVFSVQTRQTDVDNTPVSVTFTVGSSAQSQNVTMTWQHSIVSNGPLGLIYILYIHMYLYIYLYILIGKHRKNDGKIHPILWLNQL